jgi:PKHD-type hydroxylase
MNKYHYIHRYFAPDFVDYFIHVAEKHEYQRGLVINADGTVALDEKRNCSIIPIDVLQEVMVTNQLMFMANRLNSYFQFDINLIREITLTMYETGGEYDWHQDVNWKEPISQRKLTMVIQLTDPSQYDGGDLELMDCEMSEKDKAAIRDMGSVIIFPSLLKHRVTPVTRGVRKSLVTWIEGPTWR